jgi:hypothetical protein
VGFVIELSECLARMHDASARVTSVRATVVIEYRGERPPIAVPKGAAHQGLNPRDPGDTKPARETVELWMTAGGDVREERRGGVAGPLTAIRSGPRWSVVRGADSFSSADFPDAVSGAGEEFGWLLDPSELIGALRFAVMGDGDVAGRRTVRLRGVPRAVSDPDRFVHLLRLGGADDYVLDMDAEHGVLLRVEARAGGRAFLVREVIYVAFDEGIAAHLLSC